MKENSNELQLSLLALNPYKADTKAISKRRSILYEEMCQTAKPFSSLRQFQIEITKEKMIAKNESFKSICPIVFDYDLKYAAQNLLKFLLKTVSIKRQYDPKYNKAVYIKVTSPKIDNSALVEEFLKNKKEREVA